MTDIDELFDAEDQGQETARIAYIKPTRTEEAHRLGIVPPGIKLPSGVMIYVLHAIDGSVLGYTDSWDGAYGAAVQNELTPVSVH